MNWLYFVLTTDKFNFNYNINVTQKQKKSRQTEKIESQLTPIHKNYSLSKSLKTFEIKKF